MTNSMRGELLFFAAVGTAVRGWCPESGGGYAAGFGACRGRRNGEVSYDGRCCVCGRVVVVENGVWKDSVFQFRPTDGGYTLVGNATADYFVVCAAGADGGGAGEGVCGEAEVEEGTGGDGVEAAAVGVCGRVNGRCGCGDG